MNECGLMGFTQILIISDRPEHICLKWRPEASEQVASSSNPSPQSIQQHVMLSGRFNRDDIKDYMRIAPEH